MPVQGAGNYRSQRTENLMKAEVLELKRRIRIVENALRSARGTQQSSSIPTSLLTSIYDVDINGLVDNVGIIDPVGGEILSLATLNLSANRILTLDVNDANRTLLIEADTVVDQDYSSDSATVQFAKLSLGRALGAVGYALFELYGTQANAAGPHLQAITSEDNYPVLQLLNWEHDNIQLIFDAYWDGANKSSDVGSNFRIVKSGDELRLSYDSGIAQGGVLTWNDGIILTAAGLTKIGDAVNYIEFQADGELNLHGTARVITEPTVYISALTRGAVAPDIGNLGVHAVYLFSSVLTEEVRFEIHVPPNWVVGSDIQIGVYWGPTTAAAGGVAWEFDWEAVQPENNEILGAGSTHVEVHDSTQTLADELLETSYGTIAGASLAEDDVVGVHFYRDHDDAFDDYGADAALVHIEVKIMIDKLGEAT